VKKHHYSNEKRPPWLQALYRAQAAMDSGVRLAVRGESQLRQCAPACAPGCAGCCSTRHPLATAVEAAGALLHQSLTGVQWSMDRLLAPEGQGCPFLEGGHCSVYPMRPLSCRQLVVFGRACRPGEDPARVRPGDVLTPLHGHASRAFSFLLAHLGAGPGAVLADFVKPVRSLDPGHVLRLLGQGAARAAA